MPRWTPLVIMLALAPLLAPAASVGQDASARPRIGLCLAGGGARGGAHIGVLKVLEELRVPVDCIAGTSIGSIIGGLYASGMSPADMDSAVLNLDWDELFDDSPPRQLVNFRRKQEDRLPYFDFEFGVGRHGLKTPAGLIAGQKLNFLLRELTLHTTGIEDFDHLPLPFRAVAADLDDGSIVVMADGNLADAMRASMAIPGAFTPHEVNGRILVDGGIVRNVPYDVVKALGADVVITVDVGTPPSELTDDLTIVGVLLQTIVVGTETNAARSRAEMDEHDILLVPHLEGVRTESFDRMALASARGEAVAREMVDRLRELSLDEADYEAWRARQRVDWRHATIPIDHVRVDTEGRVDPRRVARRVKSRPGTALDLDVVARDQSRVYRIGEFELVDFSLEPAAATPARDLVIHTRDKRWGPNYLRLGMAMEGHLDGQAEFVVVMYHRRAAINSMGAEWRNQASLGNRLGLDSEFYQPLTLSGRFFVAPRVSGLVDKRQRYLDFDVSELVSSRQIAGNLDVGVNLSHWGELRLGAYRGEYWGDADNQPEEENFDERLGGWRGRLAFDQLDDLYFPQHGWLIEAMGELSRAGLGAATEYERVHARARGAVTTGRFTLHGRIEAGTSFGQSLPFHDRFELGGLGRLSGLQRGRLFGDDLVYLNAGGSYRIARIPKPLGGDVLMALYGETGQVWTVFDEPALDDLLLGFTGFLGAETLVGPVYLGYGWVEPNHSTIYLVLGRAF